MCCTYQTVNLNINLKTGANVLSVEANIKTRVNYYGYIKKPSHPPKIVPF